MRDRSRPSPADRDPTPEGEALYELIVQLPRLNAQLQADARRGQGPATRSEGWSEGLWSLLRSLKLDGPRTVPQIARTRDVARQRVQSLADDAVAAGLAAFRDNPDHRRSRLLVLTPKGNAAFEAIDARLRAAAGDLAANMDVRDLDAALRVLFELSERLRRRRN